MKQSLVISELMRQFPHSATVLWMGVRVARKQPLESRQTIDLDPEQGLLGDHYASRSKKRQLTLISAEHLAAVAAYLKSEPLTDGVTRRNVVISGINPSALKGQRFRLGSAVLSYTNECHPCSRMEQILGAGGYNAMRGHGGICARVLEPGRVCLGDPLTVLVDA